MTPTALYIHIPFCISKCAYCDFVSFANQQALFEPYLEALEREAQARRTDRPITSVYVGGGTPTILPERLLFRLFEIIHGNYTLADGAEISMECNPATADVAKLRALRDIGLNRLSIGVQSSCDRVLKALGRAHSYADFVRTYTDAREVGFDNVNLDLMYGLPEQSFETLRSFMDEIARLAPEHVSAYSLILEDGTPLHGRVMRNEVSLPDIDTVADMMQFVNAALPQMGYARYEISNFAKAGRECRHNQLYWERGNYVGLGCASHSLWDNVRRENTPSLERYVAEQAFSETAVGYEDAMFERVMLALRTANGLCYADFEREFGTDARTVYANAIGKHLADGTLVEADGFLRPTEYGMDILNTVLLDFM